MMRHTDLASLALESDDIVLARRVGDRDGGSHTVLSDHVVTKVYAGTLGVGATVTLDYGVYALAPLWGWGPRDGGAPKMNDEVVLFLVRPSATNGYAPAPGGYWLAQSGLRVAFDGEVYRFEQRNNPGPFEPVPQGRDPFDVLGDPRGGTRGVPLAVFEMDLAKAIARAKDIRDALDQMRDHQGRARLLDLLGPESDDDALFARMSAGFYEDEAASMILRKIALEKDPALFLDAIVRARGRVDLFGVRSAFSAEDLIAEARSAKRTVPERIAAIEYVHAQALDKVDDAAVIALLGDPDADVRAAAAALIGYQASPSSPRGRALVEQFRVETDDRVRYALVVAARDAKILQTLPKRDISQPILSARRQGDAVVLAWASFDDRSYRLERVVVHAKSDHATRSTIRSLGELGGWSSTNVAGTTVFLGFDPPLDVGRYAIDIDCDFVGPKSERAMRHVALAPMQVRSEPAPPVPTPRDAASPAPIATEHEALKGPLVTNVSTRACGCSVIGVESVDGVRVALLAGALLAAVAARRRARFLNLDIRRRALGMQNLPGSDRTAPRTSPIGSPATRPPRRARAPSR